MTVKCDYITIHCSDTPEGVYFDTEDIDSWHKERGWDGCGYHYVILLDGTIQFGRMVNKRGAHVGGKNLHNIGICYIGGKSADLTESKDTRTQEQKDSLFWLLQYLRRCFPVAEIKGHRDWPGVQKECPSYDAETEHANI